MATAQSPFFSSEPPLPHLHVLGGVCPLCEQPIPTDRFEEIKARIEAREHEHVDEIRSTLQQQFAKDRQRLVEEAAAEAEQKVAAARVDATKAAQETALVKIAAVEREKQEAQQALLTAKSEAAVREAQIKSEAIANAEAAILERFRLQEVARLAAEAKAASAEDRLRLSAETHQAQLAQQREALETAKTAAVNEAKAAEFKDKLKLSEKIDALQRDLEKKTNEELGEGAEIDLFETLRAEFPNDRIQRVGKGQPGADIRHMVVHNGRDCGAILYDSKNHAAWRNDFVTKLAADQMADRAEHAILATRAFPAGVRQVQLQGGVILANPARVAALVQILRKHIIHTHSLKLSGEERSKKTAAIYEFITSERCTGLLAKIDAHAEDLLELQVKEKRAHDATWKRQGELYRSIQRTRVEVCNQIDSIISESAL